MYHILTEERIATLPKKDQRITCTLCRKGWPTFVSFTSPRREQVSSKEKLNGVLMRAYKQVFFSYIEEEDVVSDEEM